MLFSNIATALVIDVPIYEYLCSNGHISEQLVPAGAASVQRYQTMVCERCDNDDTPELASRSLLLAQRILSASHGRVK